MYYLICLCSTSLSMGFILGSLFHHRKYLHLREFKKTAMWGVSTVFLCLGITFYTAFSALVK